MVRPTSSKRSHFLRRAALAPTCLCLVAALHLGRVWTANQTPWKGGGFGMFSTIDDESARFLRCYLLTDDGELPLALPPAADKTVAELRAAPTQSGLDELAKKLATQSWRWRDERQLREASAIQGQGGVQIQASTFKPIPPAVDCTPTHGVGRHHVIEPIPRDESSVSAIKVHAVRLECRRYQYDAAKRLLSSQPLLSSTAKASVKESHP